MKYISLNRINRLYVLLFILLIIICILVFFQVERRINASDSSLILLICTILTTGGGLLSICMIIKELNASANIANADFIVKLNIEFLKTEEIMKVYRKLEGSFSYYTENEGKWRTANFFLGENDKVAIVSYLTYFETIYYLLDRKFIELDDINDMFARRFFIAVHNPEFQDYLLKNNKYHKNIFILYAKWKHLRDTKIQQTLGYPENSLDGNNSKKLKAKYNKYNYDYEILTKTDKTITYASIVNAVKDGNLLDYLKECLKTDKP